MHVSTNAVLAAVSTLIAVSERLFIGERDDTAICYLTLQLPIVLKDEPDQACHEY